MGAFLLVNNSHPIDGCEVERIFRKQGLEMCRKLSVGDYDLWFYKRILVDEDDYVEKGDTGIYLIGTFIYKRQPSTESLWAFLRDLQKGDVDYQSVLGHFILIVKEGDRLKILMDRLNLVNLYHDSRNMVFSSSFLAVAFLAGKSLTVNKLALTEILLTGGLIGPDTPFHEICRLEEDKRISGSRIEFYHVPIAKPEGHDQSREKSIRRQLDVLDHYFESIAPLADENGLVMGLTGGFDSRLLMSLAERHFRDVEYYSHWRRQKTKELEVAEELADQVGKRLSVPEVEDPLQIAESEAWDNLEKGFWHFDGHIRTQAYWHEPYNNSDYNSLVYRHAKLGMSGVGGEQYRNSERMVKRFWTFDSWLRYEVIYRFSTNVFSSKLHEDHFIEYVSGKIRKKLELGSRKHIDHLDVKRYYNEIHNVSNRAVRASMENKAVYFLCPFVDPVVSFNAYRAVPFLGNSLSFEAEMIKRINPRLARIPSNYGYDFHAGETVGSKMNGYIKELVPRSLFFRIYHRKRNTRNDDFFATYSQTFTYMRELKRSAAGLDLDIDLEKLSRVRDTGWLLISLGYFAKTFQDGIAA